MIERLLITDSGGSDPEIKNVIMQLRGEGANGSQNNSIVDSSTNNFTVTRVGDVAQGTFSPFSKNSGNWSIFFDGSGDYITFGSNSAFSLGTGDFTVEAWIFISGGSDFSVFNVGTASTGSYSLYWLNSTQKFESVRYGDPAGSGVTTSTYGINRWYHVAAVRSSGSAKLYINGVADSGATYSMGNITATSAECGRIWSGVSATNNGYVSNLRVVKGTAVYTANFTPPVNALSAITNTQLLTCRDNRFIDNSVNSFSITKNGDVRVSAFSPLVNNYEYSNTLNGGSYYFDGNGDYFSVNSNTAFQFGSGNWTIEFWIYPTTFAGYNVIVGHGYNAASNARSFILYIDQTTGLLRLAQSSTGSNNSDNSTGITLKLNEWQHVAIVRNSSNVTSYLNGVSSGTNISAVSLYATSLAVTIGVQNDLVNYFTGYLSDVHLVKGTAVYTGNFSVPTAPLTKVANTSLLLSATNSGVFDTTKMSHLTTIGNAQTSTTQSKFGSSSIAFDGTGDYLLTISQNSSLYAFGTGAFTIEFWAYFNTVSGVQVLYDSRPTSTNGAYPVIYANDTSLRIYVNSSDQISGGTLTANTWHHIALSRSGTSSRLFLNGTQVGSTYTDSNSYLNGALRPAIGTIGFNLGAAGYGFNGYIDELRVTKGHARYTGTFTVPNGPFLGV